MLTVCGKIQSASKSATGKSVSVNVGGTWVHVATDDLEAFKDAIGKGEPIEVRARTDLVLDDDGSPKMRTFKKRDGSQGTGPDIRCRFWFRAPGGDSGLSELIGVDAKAGSADAE
jgi:hypothetical protein